MNNFDLRKFLIENKLTSTSKKLTQEEIDNSDWAMKARAQAHDARTWNSQVEARIEEIREVHSDFKKDLDTHLNKIPSDATKLQLVVDEDAHRSEFETTSDKGTMSPSEIKKEIEELFARKLKYSILEKLENLIDNPGDKKDAFQSVDMVLDNGLYLFEDMEWLENIYDDYQDTGMYPVVYLQIETYGSISEIIVLADKPLPGFKS
jgi:hypothetical protein